MSNAQHPTGLVLWDIDGTLLRIDKFFRVLFDRDIVKVTGQIPTIPVNFNDTEPRVVADKLITLGIEPDRCLVEQILRQLEELLCSAIDAGEWSAKPLPGVIEVLSALSNRESVVSSVLTGGTLGNAMTKLRAGGLFPWLDLSVGAFGSDKADRNALVPVARRRFAEHFGSGADVPAIVVVGDTPADFACARAGEAQCLLVATGRFTLTEFNDLGALAVLPDLADTQTVLRLLDQALALSG
jgi:phosphoglycolate phosphatase-like HAD superfamily hydrolase